MNGEAAGNNYNSVIFAAHARSNELFSFLREGRRRPKVAARARSSSHDGDENGRPLGSGEALFPFIVSDDDL